MGKENFCDHFFFLTRDLCAFLGVFITLFFTDFVAAFVAGLFGVFFPRFIRLLPAGFVVALFVDVLGC